MAKRAQQRDEGKTRFELRFDDDLYTQVKNTADETGISVNQLMQGIARWAMSTVHPRSEPWGQGPELLAVEHEGCVWFGRESGAVEDDYGNQHYDKGAVYFTLDFTERHVVRGFQFKQEEGEE